MASSSDSIRRLNAALEGHFRVERAIGEATVHLAHDERKNRNVALKVLLFLLSIVLCPTEATAQASGSTSGPAATFFEGALLLTGGGGAEIGDAVFVVEDGLFTQVGGPGEIDVPIGAVRVDLTGKTVIPGLVNSHVHLDSGVRVSVPLTREAIVDHLRRNAYYGVVAVASLGSDSGRILFGVEDAVISDAARPLRAGRGITRPEPGLSEVPYWINTEEEGREAVRELADQGANMIKIWVDDRNGQYEKLTPQLYGAIIEQADRQNLRVTAHISGLEDAKGLLRAGVGALAGGIRDLEVDEEFLTLIRERPDVVYVPNLSDPGVARDLSWLSGTVPLDQVSRLQRVATERPESQEVFAIQAHNLARLNEAGVKIAFGTDGRAPWASHLEMEDMVSAGMTPAQVIVAATQTAAEFMGLDDLGTIEAGKSADFIVLDGNPLEDISNTRRISAVYLRGEQMDRAALSEQLVGATGSRE